MNVKFLNYLRAKYTDPHTQKRLRHSSYSIDPTRITYTIQATVSSPSLGSIFLVHCNSLTLQSFSPSTICSHSLSVPSYFPSSFQDTGCHQRPHKAILSSEVWGKAPNMFRSRLQIPNHRNFFFNFQLNLVNGKHTGKATDDLCNQHFVRFGLRAAPSKCLHLCYFIFR